MTATLMPPPPAASALRVLPIAADLLPAEVVDSRQERRTRRTVLAALAGAVVLLVAWFGLAMYQTSQARSGLAAAQDEQQRMTSQQKSFRDLVATQSQTKAISAELSSLLANDLQWSRLLASLRSAAPAGVTVGGVSGALNNANSNTGKATLPGTPGDKAVGSLTVTGTAPSRAAVAAYVDALSRVTGLANPLVTNASIDSGKVTFSLRLDITRAALGGRFTSPSPSAGK
ncbi:MAG TPA: hypothetical protein VJT31_32340 [Rugosimonospora sp.]|nr:hypothetical protein [Rugosimonospora sp.]